MALMENVRGELRKEKVKLWEPPYTIDASAQGIPEAVKALASTYAERLQAQAPAVQIALEELRQHALEKLRAKTRVSILGRVTGSAQISAKGTEISAAFDIADSGAKVREALIKQLGVLRMKILAGGRTLLDENSLGDQGWKCDTERENKPLKVMLLCSGIAPPVEALPAAASEANAIGAASDGSTAAASSAGQVAAAPAIVPPCLCRQFAKLQKSSLLKASVASSCQTPTQADSCRYLLQRGRL